MPTRYRATVIDLVPGLSDEERAEQKSEAEADTIAEAERKAIEGSATNCNRRVYVAEADNPCRIVKGPYILRRAGTDLLRGN